jgi:hypothetical protein
MAPYTPPIAHYSEMDVSEYTEHEMYDFIGKGGRRFYWLTRFLGLQYLWYDEKRRKIEIWGAPYTHENRQSAHVIDAELQHFRHGRSNALGVPDGPTGDELV